MNLTRPKIIILVTAVAALLVAGNLVVPQSPDVIRDCASDLKVSLCASLRKVRTLHEDLDSCVFEADILSYGFATSQTQAPKEIAALASPRSVRLRLKDLPSCQQWETG